MADTVNIGTTTIPTDLKGGLKVNGTTVINANGELTDAASGPKQYSILKPEVGVAVVVSAQDISIGGDISATTVRTILDYPRNLLYTLVDDSGTTLEAIFVVVGTDQFGAAATETATVDFSVAATTAGSQIFATITSVTITPTNQAASDTASVGVAIAADVASFGLPQDISAVTDVKGINWIDAGVSKTQNIDATSVSIANNAIQPEQTIAAADDYIVYYEAT